MRPAHVRAMAGLPEFHKDPFDRILVAQSLAEGLTLVTKDAILARYWRPRYLGMNHGKPPQLSDHPSAHL